jgi:glutamate synthase (ferredoxin)
VLGRTGRNFAAGMSGGVAYVLDPDGDFERRCNRDMVELEPLMEAQDIHLVRTMIAAHVRHTGSTFAASILERWNERFSRFVRVMPRDYKRVLMAEARARSENRELEFAEVVAAVNG